MNTDTSDAIILTTNAEIPVGSPSVCVYVVAYDDSIAEFNESVLILARPNSPLDLVNQLTTLLIIDDDGLYNRNYYITVFLLKIQHGNNNIALASPNF